MFRKIMLAIWVAVLLALMFALSLATRPQLPWHEIWDRSQCAPHCQP